MFKLFYSNLIKWTSVLMLAGSFAVAANEPTTTSNSNTKKTTTTNDSAAVTEYDDTTAGPTTAVSDTTNTTTVEETQTATATAPMMDEEDDNKDAGLFVEPTLIMAQTESSIKTSQLPLVSSDSSGNTRGYGLGARLGFHINEMIFVSADGRYSKSKFSDSAYGSADNTSWNLGPTLGFQAPRFGMRLWGTYVTAGSSDPESGSQGFDARFNDPRGWRAGAGFRIASVSLNAEYEELKYDTTNIQSFGGVAISGASAADLVTRGYLLSVSFPIQL